MVTKLISCILVASLILVSSVPVVNAQDSYSDVFDNIILARGEDAAEASAAAESDAKKDVSTPLWFAAGFFLALLGVLLAYVIPPTPPPERLIGKSAEYVTVYASTYRSASVRRQANAAWLGCGTCALLNLILMLIPTGGR